MSVLHVYHSKIPFRLVKGKPSVVVSAKGMSNGLSDIYNDGADFGPDTMLGATAPDQYGPPYTNTSGIQEAINYVFNQGGGEIVLGEGVFEMDADYVKQQGTTTNGHVINVPYNSFSNPIITISIRGSAPPLDDYQTGYNASPSITPTNMKKGTIIYNPADLPSSEANGAALFGATPPPSGATLNNNVNILLTDLTFTSVQPNGQNYLLSMVQLDNFAGFYLKNVVVNVNTPNGALYNPESAGANGISINQSAYGNGLAVLDNVYVVNYLHGIWANSVQHLHIKLAFVQYCTIGLLFGGITGNYPPAIDLIDLEQNTYPVVFINDSSNPIWLFGGRFQIQNAGAYSSTNWSNAVADFLSGNSGAVYGEIEVYFDGGGATVSDTPLFGAINGTVGGATYNGSVSNLYGLVIHQIEGLYSIGTYPIGSRGTTTAGTTAGTVAMQFETYRSLYKKLLIQVSGYENNTTTNQTINFPLSFSTYAGVTMNTTGLTVSASTSGITITAPNSTTTYSGMIIVEGY